MCGRFSLYSSPRYFGDYFDARVDPALDTNYVPSYNVPPTEQILAVGLFEGERWLGRYRWGLIPFFATSPAVGARAFNARAEQVDTKSFFRAAFESRRVIVPANSFFEWSQRERDKKTPYCISRRDGQPLCFAGLRERWHHKEGLVIDSVAIITTAASDDLAAIHDRMPVVLEPPSWSRWLSTPDPAEAKSLLVPSPRGTLCMYPVDKRVGSVKNDDESLLQPVDQIEAPTLPF